MFSYSDIKKDWFNREGRRNVYNTDIDFYNCGGFALGTYSWYTPYSRHFEKEDMIDLIVESIQEGYSYEEITSEILNHFEKQMLKDFDNLRPVAAEYVEKENEELIAFRIFYDIEFFDFDEVDFFDFDFHYRVKRKGNWLEKCGDGPITPCNNSREAWGLYDEEGLCYDSEIRYYVRTLN